MPKVKRAEVARAQKEVDAVVNNQAVLDALEEAAADRAVLEQAKKNGRAFLKKKGVDVPRNVKLTFTEGGDEAIRVTVCVRACISAFGFTACASVCVSFTL